MIGNLDESNSDLDSDLTSHLDILAKKKQILRGKRVRVSPKISNAHQKMKPELPKLVNWKEYEEVCNWLQEEEANLDSLEKFTTLAFSSDPAEQRYGIMILKRVIEEGEELLDSVSKRKIFNLLKAKNEPILQKEALTIFYSICFEHENFEDAIPSIEPLIGLLKSPQRIIVSKALITIGFLSHAELFRTRFLQLGGMEQITRFINKTTDKVEIDTAAIGLLSIFPSRFLSFEEIRFIIPTLCSLIRIRTLNTKIQSQIALVLASYSSKLNQLQFIADTGVIQYITSNLNHDISIGYILLLGRVILLDPAQEELICGNPQLLSRFIAYLNHPDKQIRERTHKVFKTILQKKGLEVSLFILKPGYLQGLCEINSDLYQESCAIIRHALINSDLDDIEETIIIKLFKLLINSLRSDNSDVLSDALAGVNTILNWGQEKAREKNLDKNPLFKEINEKDLREIIEKLAGNMKE